LKIGPMEKITKQELVIARWTLLNLILSTLTLAALLVLFIFFDLQALPAAAAALLVFLFAKKSVENQKADSLKLYYQWLEIVPYHTKAREYLEKRIKFYKEKLSE
jgi:hypothetical protein